MKFNVSKILGYSPLAMCLLSAQLVIFSTMAFAKSSGGGVIGGGGGDASELRVNEIRSDILKWINEGGSKGLNLQNVLTQEEYISQMTDILQPKKVVIGFVEKDDEVTDELKVSVNGEPKTCRGFISVIDFKPHILCNISRFASTSDSDQYKLIHHEFAGLAKIENNDGAASDYFVSSQITDYLRIQTVLKLAVKKSDDVISNYSALAISDCIQDQERELHSLDNKVLSDFIRITIYPRIPSDSVRGATNNDLIIPDSGLAVVAKHGNFLEIEPALIYGRCVIATKELIVKNSK